MGYMRVVCDRLRGVQGCSGIPSFAGMLPGFARSVKNSPACLFVLASKLSNTIKMILTLYWCYIGVILA